MESLYLLVLVEGSKNIFHRDFMALICLYSLLRGRKSNWIMVASSDQEFHSRKGLRLYGLPVLVF